MIPELLRRYCESQAAMPPELLHLFGFLEAVLFAGAGAASLVALQDKSTGAVMVTGVCLFFGVLIATRVGP